MNNNIVTKDEDCTKILHQYTGVDNETLRGILGHSLR